MPFVARAMFLRSLAYLLVLEAMLVPGILFWPDFKEHAQAISEMVPSRFRSLVTGFAQGGVESYVCGQHYFKACNTLGVAAAVLFAAGAVAGEIDRGTFEIWLARPFTRRRLLLERWLAGALAVVLPVYLSSATIPFLLERIGESMSQYDLLLCSTLESLLLLVIYSATFLWSTVGRRPAVIVFGMFFFCIFEFAIYVVQTANAWSLFKLVDFRVFSRVCLRETLPPITSTAFGALTVALLACSLILFQRRTP